MFGWLWEGRDEAAQRAAGWAGVMSLPRLLTPRGDGRVGMEPAPELRVLRGHHTSMRDVRLDSSRAVDTRGAALEIVAEIRPDAAAQLGLKVRCAPGGAEETVISFDTASRWLAIDRQRASLDLATQRDTCGTSVAVAEGEPVRLQVFVDHSVVEVFANGHACLTSRIYPSRSDSLGVEVFAAGGCAHLSALDVWQMGAIWPQRTTA